MNLESSGPSAPSALSRRRMVLAGLFLILLVYVGLALVCAVTSRPNGDEGLFSDPAISLITKGYMGTSVREPTGGPPGLERWTYWVMPLHLVILAGWYKIFGIGLFQMRFLAIFWGSVGLAALVLLIWRLSRDVWVVIVTAALGATDYLYVGASTSGRMDGMAAALGFVGLAVYCSLRERNLLWALLLAHLSVAAAVFTHPNGILFFAGLMFLTVALDRDRLRLSYLTASFLPYLAGAAAWGIYIMQSPHAFVAQWLWQIDMKSGGKLGFSPMGYIESEFHRYMDAYGMGNLHAKGISGPVAMKGAVLAAYVGAALVLLCARELRGKRGYQLLLALTGLLFVIMMFFNEKLTRYLLNITPLYDAILAIALVWFYRRGRVAKGLAILALCILLTIQAGGMLLRSKFNTYGRQFSPAAEFVRHRLHPETTLVASADFGFGIGFDRVTDDWTLGFYSHKLPELIVIEEQYLHAFDTLGRQRPEINQYVSQTLKQDYALIYDHEYYKVYQRLPNL